MKKWKSELNKQHKRATALAAQLPCVVCHRIPSEPCHFPKHRGMGGRNAGWAITEWVPACREHHQDLDNVNGVSDVERCKHETAQRAASFFRERLYRGEMPHLWTLDSGE